MSTYQIKWRKFLAIGCASVFSIFVFTTRFGLKNSWTGSYPLPIAVITILTFGMVYIGSTLILNLIANIWILYCTFKRQLSRKGFNEKGFNEFPVFPFDVQPFRRFLLTVPTPLLPLLLGVMKTVTGAFLKKWGIDLG